MKTLWALSLLLAAMPAQAAPVTVESAIGDWSGLPQLSQRGYDHLSSQMMARLHEIAAARKCSALGLQGNRLDLRISFMAHFTPGGQITRLVLPKLDCPEAEGILGGAVLEMVAAGDYRPTGRNLEGWYRGSLGFSFEE
jgi:hypothetical protein